MKKSISAIDTLSAGLQEPQSSVGCKSRVSVIQSYPLLPYSYVARDMRRARRVYARKSCSIIRVDAAIGKEDTGV